MEDINHISHTDLADTGLWKLIVYISEHGIQAWLKSLADNKRVPVEIFNKQWNVDADTNILRNIENAVYDNPRVLDDFSADIIIETSKVLWMPDTSAVRDNESSYFAEVFPALSDDILIEELPGMLCVYALCQGLPSFLNRTFPGARIHCHQSLLFSKYTERPAERPQIFIDITDNCVTYIGISNKNLLFASTTDAASDNNIIYNLFNAIEAFDMQPRHTHVYISGNKERRIKIAPELRKIVEFVMPTMMPRIYNSVDMPTAALLCANREYAGTIK